MEECPYWTGEGCICGVFDIEPAEDEGRCPDCTPGHRCVADQDQYAQERYYDERNGL